MRGRVASAEEPEACVRARARACELMFARASARACARVHTHADQCCRRRKARQRRRGSLCRGWAERHPAKWRQPIHATRLPYRPSRPQCLLSRDSDSGLEDSFDSGIYNSGYASIGPSEDPAMDFRLKRSSLGATELAAGPAAVVRPAQALLADGLVAMLRATALVRRDP